MIWLMLYSGCYGFYTRSSSRQSGQPVGPMAISSEILHGTARDLTCYSCQFTEVGPTCTQFIRRSNDRSDKRTCHRLSMRLLYTIGFKWFWFSRRTFLILYLLPRGATKVGTRAAQSMTPAINQIIVARLTCSYDACSCCTCKRWLEKLGTSESVKRKCDVFKIMLHWNSLLSNMLRTVPELSSAGNSFIYSVIGLDKHACMLLSNCIAEETFGCSPDNIKHHLFNMTFSIYYL